MLGYREDEVCGMSCSQFANPEDSQDDWSLFRQLRAGVINRHSLEKRYVSKHEAQFWGRLNVSLLRRRNTNVRNALVEEELNVDPEVFGSSRRGFVGNRLGWLHPSLRARECVLPELRTPEGGKQRLTP
jgi:hypothetical protein